MTWPTAQLLAWIERLEARAVRASYFELLDLGPSADTESITAAFHRIAGGAHPDLHRKTLGAADAERLLRAYGKVAAAYDTLRDPGSRQRYRRELAERGRSSTSQAPVLGGSQPIPVQRPGSASSSGSFAIDPLLARTKTPSEPLKAARSGPISRATTTPPAIARTTTPPAIARTTTPPAIARTTTPPAVARTTTPPRPGSTRPRPDSRPPLITPAPPNAPTSTSPPVHRKDSRPPTGGVGPRAQVYFRKAQGCLAQGDLGGALFNLRLAAAADPGSALIRVALAEVETELRGRK